MSSAKLDCDEIASNWLSLFSSAVQCNDMEALLSLFLPNGWLRDILVFDWNNRSLHGLEAISKYLKAKASLADYGVSNLRLDNVVADMSPEPFSASSNLSGVQFGIRFETPLAWGRGFVRLLADEKSEWKALTVFTMVDDWKGHEEHGLDLNLYHAKTWEKVAAEERQRVESDPDVVIIGAGHSGLMTAARLKQMGIRALVVEKNAEIGDNWRLRYPILSLHTTRAHSSFLYQPFPKNWPRYAPRVKIADWHKQYVSSLDLVAWTNSQPLPRPTYDTAKKRWSITVDRAGQKVTLHPAHIIAANGLQSAPYVPTFRGMEDFKGIRLHTKEFQGSGPFQGKNVLIIGTGNSANDVAHDLALHDAGSVTIVQRSPTCAVSTESLGADLDAIFLEGEQLESSDFKNASMPLGLIREVLRSREPEMWERDKELHSKLRKGGMRVSMGPDGSGYYPLFWERSGGYWIDVGCADLIASGRVQIKYGSVDRFTTDGLIFDDGSNVRADVVVFGTGFYDSREDLKALFGGETISRTRPLWGLDEDTELSGVYRPSGQPGLWFAAGDFSHARFMSKQLALEIKACTLGLMPLEALTYTQPVPTSKL